MIVLGHARRQILHVAVTQHPTQDWLSQQVTEAFPWDTAPRYLLRDRDASYGSRFRKRVEATGIDEVVTAPRSPWQNPNAERVIGSIRRECLDHIIVFNAGICDAYCRPTSTTITDPGLTLLSTRIARTNDRSNHPAWARRPSDQSAKSSLAAARERG